MFFRTWLKGNWNRTAFRRLSTMAATLVDKMAELSIKEPQALWCNWQCGCGVGMPFQKNLHIHVGCFWYVNGFFPFGLVCLSWVHHVLVPWSRDFSTFFARPWRPVMCSSKCLVFKPLNSTLMLQQPCVPCPNLGGSKWWMIYPIYFLGNKATDDTQRSGFHSGPNLQPREN